MEKPKVKELETIVNRVAEIHGLEAQLKQHKDMLKTETRNLISVEDKTEQLAAARYAYWMLPEIAVEDIAFALTKKRNKQFMNMMGDVTVGLECDVCKDVLPITSRTQMNAELEKAHKNVPAFAEGYKHVCDSCYPKIFERRKAQDKRQKANRELEVSRLQSLPYDQYLETPEWRKEKWEMMDLRRRIGGMDAVLTCEICPETSGLDLKHKFKNAIGRENFDNTIVLCKQCIQLLEVTGRIVS